MQTMAYFVKSISFQNQFWSIVFYVIAVVVSLSLIFVDEASYVTLYLDNANVFNQTATNFLVRLDTVRFSMYISYDCISLYFLLSVIRCVVRVRIELQRVQVNVGGASSVLVARLALLLDIRLARLDLRGAGETRLSAHRREHAHSR